jgi:hypothetical protein
MKGIKKKSSKCQKKMKRKSCRREKTMDVSSIDLYQPENSMALVRERTIPTERPPPVGEVSANFSG